MFIFQIKIILQLFPIDFSTLPLALKDCWKEMLKIICENSIQLVRY